MCMSCCGAFHLVCVLLSGNLTIVSTLGVLGLCPLSDVKTTCDACECTGCIVSSRCDHKSQIRTVVWAVAKTAHMCQDVFRVSSWLACCDWDSSLPCRCKVPFSFGGIVWRRWISVTLIQYLSLVLHLQVSLRISRTAQTGVRPYSMLCSFFVWLVRGRK